MSAEPYPEGHALRSLAELLDAAELSDAGERDALALLTELGPDRVDTLAALAIAAMTSDQRRRFLVGAYATRYAEKQAQRAARKGSAPVSDKKATMTTIDPSGEVTTLAMDPASRPTLEALQAAVGGYIERVPRVMREAYVDEDGSLKRLPPNPKGSARVGFNGLLLGPVVILDGFDPDPAW